MHRRPGFTLIELLITSGLMGFLAILVSSAWFAFGRSIADSTQRCRVVQEASLAFETLARDLGGQHPETTTGGRELGREVGRLVVSSSRWMLCFDGEPADDTANWTAPDTVISYELVDGQLVRRDENTGAMFVVATNVEQLVVEDETDGIRIELTLRYRDLTRTFTMLAEDP